MIENPYNIWFKKIAKALGRELPNFVFVGGAVVSFYLDDLGFESPRPTRDVDCVIDISTQKEFRELEVLLQSKGFKHDMTGGPLCRWFLEEVVIDVMPAHPKLLGFTNKWYVGGILHKTKLVLVNKTEIYIFTAPYFIASKLEAFFGRKEKDMRYSHDIEDIMTVLDGCSHIVDQVRDAPAEVKKYLVKTFGTFKKNDLLEDVVMAHIGSDDVAMGRSKLIHNKINQIVLL